MKRFLLFTAPVLMIGALAFLLLFPADEPGIINLIDRFQTAEKTNFEDGELLDSYMPAGVYAYNIFFLNDITTSLFSHKDRYKIKNLETTFSVPFKLKNSVIRLVFKGEHRAGSEFTYNLKNEKGENLKIKYIIKPRENRLIITKSNGNGFETISDFAAKKRRNERNLLTLLLFDDYLILYTDKKLLFQMKDSFFRGEIVLDGGLRSKLLSDYRYTFRVQDVDSETLKKIRSFQENRIKRVPEHIFSFDGKKHVWNILFVRRYIFEPDAQNAYLRRLKRRLITLPCIYFQMDSSLKYRVTMPEKPVLEFALTAVPEYINDPARVQFEISVDPGKDYEKFQQTISLRDLANKINRFNSFRYELQGFGGKECEVSFRLRTVDGKLLKDEEKIIAALGSPVILSSEEKQEKNVILISLDTLRADRLSCYGNRRKTSPEIDRVAVDGMRFENCTANSNWTLPSHLSIFTSMFPFETGHIRGSGQHGLSYLADELKSLPQYLYDAGYYNAGIHGGGFVSEGYGFDKGFHYYYKAGKDAAETVDKALEILKLHKNRKFFLFLHTFEIHGPYTRDIFTRNLPEKTGNKEKIIAAYDSGIKYTDEQFGRLFEYLRGNGLWENTLIIITSDHGESFTNLDRTRKTGTHGTTLYEEEIHIPLILAGAEEFAGGKLISKQVSSVDILPTILAWLDIKIQQQVRGKDLLNLDTGANKQRFAFSEAVNTKVEKKSLRSVKYKLIKQYPGARQKLPAGQTEHEFYNMTSDRQEKYNIYKSNRDRAEVYIKMMKSIIKSIRINFSKYKKHSRTGVTEDEELQKDLQNLGYLGG